MRKILCVMSFALLFVCQPIKAQFADPWYNWYYSQQMMLNQQMFNLNMQQHQITEFYRNQAEQKTRELFEHPTEPMSPNVPRSESGTDYSHSSSDRICGTCKGDGKCISCHGSGYRTDNLFGTGVDYSKKCGVCGGNGRCNSCRGTGSK